MQEEKWYLYIIQTEGNKLYTGITKDIDRRFQEHQSGKKGARFFRSDPAQKLLYQEEFSSRSEASKREAFIKKLSRPKKAALIAGESL